MILIFAKWLLVYVLEHKRNFHVIIIFHYKDCGFLSQSAVNQLNY